MRNQIQQVCAVAASRLTDQRRQVRSSPAAAAITTGLIATLTFIFVRPTGPSAYTYGALFDTAPKKVLAVTTNIYVTIIVLIVVFYVMRGATNTAGFDVRKRFCSLHTPLRIHVPGILLAEVTISVLLGLIPLVGIATAFSVGSGNPTHGHLILLLGLWTLFTVPLVGLPIGVFANYLLVSRLSSGRIKIVSGLTAIVAYDVLIFERAVYLPFIKDTPIGLLPRFALAGLPPTRTALMTSGVLPVVSVFVFGAATRGCEALASDVWNPNKTDSTSVDSSSGRTVTSITALVSEYVPRLREPLAVTHLTTRTVLRAPASLMYAVFPLVGLVITGYSAVTGTQPTTTLPLLTILLGTVSVGLSFTLNPLGLDSNVLPWLFSGTVDSKNYVIGTAAAGILFTAPLFCGATVVATRLAGFTLVETAIAVFLSFATLSTGALVSVTLGIRFPNTGTTTIGSEIEIPLPSKITAVPYFAYFLAVATIVTLTLANTPLSTPYTVFPGLLFFAFLGAIALRYSSAVLQDRALEILETGSYPSFRDAVPGPMAALSEILGLSVVFLANATGAGLALRWLYGSPNGVPFLGQALGTAGAYVATVGVYLVYDSSALPSAIRPSLDDIPSIAVGLLSLFGIGVIATQLIPTDQTALQISTGTDTAMGIILGGVLLIPIVEELVYRGIVQRRLSETMHATVAIGISSLLFAAPHLPNYASRGPLVIVSGLGIVFVQSFVLGTVYERTRCLGATVVVHVGYNMVAFFPYS